MNKMEIETYPTKYENVFKVFIILRCYKINY